MISQYSCIFFNYRTYLPVLKNFPTKYIHEPWTAPESVQRVAKCVIGRDYPMPMVDHIKQSQNNIERMKQVYQQLAHYRGKSEYNKMYQHNNFEFMVQVKCLPDRLGISLPVHVVVGCDVQERMIYYLVCRKVGILIQWDLLSAKNCSKI